MAHRATTAAAACLILLGAVRPAAAETVRIGLLGSSYMNSVTAALERVGLPHEQLDAGLLPGRDPGSLDVLFVAHDALSATSDSAVSAATMAWLIAFRAAGGVLCTFYSVPAPLQDVLGISQGAYLRQEYEGQFAAIRSTGVLPRLPESVPQRSGNINTATPRGDSVRVVARWFDRQGRDTGHAALLVGPGVVHLTHVLLGDDPDAAAHLYAALLSHFRPEVWPQAVAGALRAAESVAGGRDALAANARGSRRAEERLRQSEQSIRAGEQALAEGRFDAALQAAFRARALASEAYAHTQRSRPRELRAVWIHNPFGVADWGWERSLAELAQAGFNAIIPNMLDAGVTSYPSDVLPVDRRVATAGDQMAALMQAARRHGIEVHVWKVNYNLGGADSAFVNRMGREGRLQADTAGEQRPWLCPSHPDNVALEAESMLEVVRNYDADGIHFDYIRYPGVEGCYCAGCRSRFQQETGHWVRDWPQDVLTGELLEPFQVWRQEQITRLVRTVAIQARQIRPEIQISAAVFSNWPQTRFEVGQDWVRWVEAGYLDFVCPMDYIPNTEQFMARVRDQVNWVNGRVPLYIGIGSWQMAEPAEVLRQVAFTRQAGADGFVLFEYNTRLAERLFPLLRAGLTAASAQPPHRGPRARLEVAGQSSGEVLAGAAYYREDAPLELTAQLVGSSLHPAAQGRLAWETLDGGTVQELAVLRSADGRPQRHLTALAAGDYRPAVTGTYRDARNKKHEFGWRGPVVRVREAAFLDSLDRLFGPPEVPSDGIPVAVYADGYGASDLAAVLAADADLAVFQVRHLNAATLAATQVLVLPQPHNRWAVDRLTRERLRAWVRAGGSLLVTHDMVGIRGAQPVVPEVCRRGTGYPRSALWQVTAAHPAVAGVPVGLQPHSYYDHVTLEPGPDGHILAIDDENRPVLVVGEFGEGRYAALGLIPGLGPGDVEVAPAGAERALVEVLVRWLSAQ